VGDRYQGHGRQQARGLLRGGQDSGTGQPAARELRVVTDEERGSRDGHDGLCVVLLESTAMDSDKHARLLELVIQRLAVRAQRAGPLAR